MKHIFSKIGILLAGILFLAGCLDDEKNQLDPSGSSNIIQFKDPSNVVSASGAIYPVYINSYILAPTVTYEIQITNGGPDDNNSDIELSLAADATALEQYNTQVTTGLYGELPIEGDPFDLMPEELYEFPATVTIPKGQKTVTVEITFSLELFDFSKNYALPLRIVSASSGILSEHWSVVLLGIGVRNKYDGNYTVTDTAAMVDVTNSSLTGYYPLDSDLITSSANSVYMYCYTYLQGYAGHPILSNGSSSYYGSFAPVFTMEEVGTEITDGDGNNFTVYDVISVTNYYGQTAGANLRGGALNTDPDDITVNTFTIGEDGSKILEVSYIMTQAVTGSVVDRTYFYEKWVFNAPRE